MSKFSRWELAEIKATLEANKDMVSEAEDQSMIDAKLEIEKEVEGKKSNVLVEQLSNQPTLWGKVKAWFTL